MPKFIKLTVYPGDAEIWINCTQIAGFSRDEKKGITRMLHVGSPINEKPLAVVETPAEILALIEKP